MSDRLRVAVVGLGVGEAHVYGYTRRRDLFEIAVLCDRDEARAQGPLERQRRRGEVRFESDIAAVCAADDVDVVSICTPPFLHFDQVAQVVRAGKHVVCEKPIVGSLREVDELARLEADHAGRIMPVFQYRYGRGLQKLRALVAAGLTGPAYTTSIEVAWRRRPDYYDVAWRGKWATELGGVLLSHCVHALDMATYINGEPSRVFARTSVRVNPVETEDCASVSIELAGGGYLTLSATLGSAAEISRHRFCFEGLVAESNIEAYTNSSDPWTFTGDSPQQQAAIDEVLSEADADVTGRSSAEGYQRQFELFHEAVTAGGELPVSLADARRSIELVTAMYSSSREGRDVVLPIPSTHPYYGGWQP